MSTTDLAPNHHAHHAPFAGVVGLAAALTMIHGRDDDARLAIDLSGLTPGDTVVDIGSGPGVAARAAARHGATVIGVDPARVMLRVARLLTHRAPRVSYRTGAAEQLPLADQSAQVAWSIATVHHWRDIDAGLAEVRRVLADSGRFVAIERHVQPGARGHASHGWTEAQAERFSDACREHGFADVRIEHATGKRGAMLAVVATDRERRRG
jgi:ubiquinone/menaquinone biosynthesis C-methylase UbiE